MLCSASARSDCPRPAGVVGDSRRQACASWPQGRASGRRALPFHGGGEGLEFGAAELGEIGADRPAGERRNSIRGESCAGRVSERCLDPVEFSVLSGQLQANESFRMAVATTQRKFTSGHFAFMRAVVQGIDLRASWDRYLRTEGEHEDLRKVRSTIARMRTEFAATALKHAPAGDGAADLGPGRRGPGDLGAAESGGVRRRARSRGLLGARAAGGVRRGVRSGHRRRTKVAPRPPDPSLHRSAAVARAPDPRKDPGPDDGVRRPVRAGRSRRVSRKRSYARSPAWSGG